MTLSDLSIKNTVFALLLMIGLRNITRCSSGKDMEKILMRKYEDVFEDTNIQVRLLVIYSKLCNIQHVA